jgi:anaerobic magnesium-protoporphyrin IX monomethyl ester cyclase
MRQLSLAMENRIRYNRSMKLLLTTLHAKFVHSSLALPCLAAACASIDGVTTIILEGTVNEPSDQVLRRIAAEQADVVAFSCYIWNIGQTLRLASDLKKIRPQTVVLLGGPEVSYNSKQILESNPAIDCIILGEGEDTFRELICKLSFQGFCEEVLLSIPSGIAFRTAEAIMVTPVGNAIANIDTIPSPFSLGLVDLKKPLVYFETSRGCPFSCAFCMSSIDSGVRSFSLERIKQDLLILMDNCVATVKLVDRTFNYDAERANEIWSFILQHNRTSRFHFEIAADLLTGKNISLLAKAPVGTFRFEIGVQSGEERTLAKVGRKTSLNKLFTNVELLRKNTGVILHLDLVAGLPHESFAGFLASLQQLFTVQPHHIQVEPLKILKGSPMETIAGEEGYAFSDYPPYKILATPYLSFTEINRIETISRLLDIYYNSGKFRTALQAVAEQTKLADFFAVMAKFTDDKAIATHLSQQDLYKLFRQFIKVFFMERQWEPLIDALCYDYCLSEYPSPGVLADLFETEEALPETAGTRTKTIDLVKTFDISRDSKVRTYKRNFLNDYTQAPWIKKRTAVLFVYISRAGQGLQVKTLTSEILQ